MSLPDLIIDRAAQFIPVLLSLTVHEWAHAWTALRLGDDTAKMLGRVSLNPVDHIDPVGTLLLPLLGIPFGWAKPVPVNPTRFRAGVNMPMGLLITAAAGPLSNLLIAALACGLLALAAGLGPAMIATRGFVLLIELLQLFIIINVLLACFNLLPIPPLDGSRIVDALMPDKWRSGWNQFVALGPLLLLVVILLPFVGGVSVFVVPYEWAIRLTEWALSW